MLEAVKDKIIVEVLQRSKTSGGLIVPSTAVVDPQGYGKVISVGPDVNSDANSDIKEGDILVFHLNGGMAVVMNNRILKVLNYGEVYGKLTDKVIIEQLESLQLTSQEGTAVPVPEGGLISVK